MPGVVGFTVWGLPQSAGSKRAFPIKGKDGRLHVAVSDSNPKAKAWKTTVAEMAKQKYDGPLWKNPIAVEFLFKLPRPKGHYGRHGLLPSAPTHPIVKPDVLKLARAVEDALSKVLWVDDSQIVDEILRKEYTDGTPCVVVVVRELY